MIRYLKNMFVNNNSVLDLSCRLSAPKVHMVNERHWTLQIDLLSRYRPHLRQTFFLAAIFDVVREHLKTQPVFAMKIKTFPVMNSCPIIFQQMLFECSFPERAADGRPSRLLPLFGTATSLHSCRLALSQRTVTLRPLCLTRTKKSIQELTIHRQL